MEPAINCDGPGIDPRERARFRLLEDGGVPAGTELESNGHLVVIGGRACVCLDTGDPATLIAQSVDQIEALNPAAHAMLSVIRPEQFLAGR